MTGRVEAVLRHAREFKGLTVAQAASLTGFDVAALERHADLAEAHRYWRALGLPGEGLLRLVQATPVAEEEWPPMPAPAGRTRAKAPKPRPTPKPKPTRAEFYAAARFRKSKWDWSKVDWSKRNSAIAAELGCSLQSVLVNRKAWKQGPQPRLTLSRKRDVGRCARSREIDRKLASVDWSRTDLEISAALGINAHSVRERRRRKAEETGDPLVLVAASRMSFRVSVEARRDFPAELAEMVRCDGRMAHVGPPFFRWLYEAVKSGRALPRSEWIIPPIRRLEIVGLVRFADGKFEVTR